MIKGAIYRALVFSVISSHEFIVLSRISPAARSGSSLPLLSYF
jgi:hypothetical protein